MNEALFSKSHNSKTAKFSTIGTRFWRNIEKLYNNNYYYSILKCQNTLNLTAAYLYPAHGTPFCHGIPVAEHCLIPITI